MLEALLHKLQCCYIDNINERLKNLSLGIVDKQLNNKCNELYQLIAIYDIVDYDNKIELQQYVTKINNICGCDIDIDSVYVIEEDSPLRTYNFKWIGIDGCCEQYETKWIPIEPYCQEQSIPCGWVGIEPYCG